MNICIIGSGSIGGLIAANLAPSENKITVFDKGEHYEAIKNYGLKLQQLNGKTVCIDNLDVIDSLNTCEQQDIIFLAVKAHQIRSICKEIPNLLHENSTLVTLQNGIPWWFFQNYNGKFDNHILKTVDPESSINENIPSKYVIGCVSYPAAEIISPGLIKHIEGVRFPVGELDGTISERSKSVSTLLINAGFKSPILEDIRSEIWLKAWGTLAFNPISVLTKATMSQICKFQETREIVIQLMKESRNIAEQLGIKLRVPLEQRLRGAEKVGEHKTSMLQDFEAKRTLELEATLGAIIELAELTQIDVPHLRSLYAVTKLADVVNRSAYC